MRMAVAVIVVVAFAAALRMVAVIVAFVALAVSVGCVVVSAVVRMPMRALRMIAMIVARAVRVPVIVRVSVMFIEDLLRERIVLYKRLVVPVFVTAAIRTRFRLERRRRVIHMRAQTLQHVFEHGISFQFQLPRGHFHRRVAIAQVVCGARQRNGIVGVYNQHILRRSDHAHQATVVGNQHVSVAQHRAARQHQRHFLSVIQRGGQPALAAVIEGKGERRRAFDQRCGKFRFDTFIDRAHESLKKGSSAAPLARRLPARR
jgi:hypothetical protein